MLLCSVFLQSKRTLQLLVCLFLFFGAVLGQEKNDPITTEKDYEWAVKNLETHSSVSLRIADSLLLKNEARYSDKERADLLFLKAKAKLKLGDRKDALLFAKKASSLYQANNEKALVFETKTFIGESLKELGRGNEAVSYTHLTLPTILLV